jgi:hypothetical protein
MIGETRVGEVATPTEPTEPSGRGTRRLRGWLRVNWLFAIVLGLGVGLRVVTWLAYRPALIYTDSYYYLYNVDPLNPQYLDPIGYPLFVLKPLIPIGGLALVSAVQHVAGIGMALLLYRILVRRGARRWLAALATVPVLLDGYQLQIEQNILSDVWLQVLLVVLLWLLIRKGVPGWRTAAVAGVVVGMAMMVRMVAIALIVPVALYVIFAGRQWRAPGGWRRIGVRFGALAATFLVVVGGYATYFHAKAGFWGLSTSSANSIYGRTADVADCTKLKLSPVLFQLCPNEPLGQRLGANIYAHLDGDPNWPGYVPPGVTKYDLMKQFASQVIRQQPLTVAEAILADFGKGFLPVHWSLDGDPPAVLWQFQPVYPTYTMDPTDTSGTAWQQTDGIARQFGGQGISSNTALATFLTEYQVYVYTPGPLLALLCVMGLLAGFGVGRARRSGLAGATLLVTGIALVVLGTAALFEFSWRYQLPGLVLFPLAGVLAWTALTQPVPAATNDHPSG